MLNLLNLLDLLDLLDLESVGNSPSCRKLATEPLNIPEQKIYDISWYMDRYVLEMLLKSSEFSSCRNRRHSYLILSIPGTLHHTRQMTTVWRIDHQEIRVLPCFLTPPSPLQGSIFAASARLFGAHPRGKEDAVQSGPAASVTKWQAMTSSVWSKELERALPILPSISQAEGNNRKHGRIHCHIFAIEFLGDEVNGTTTGERGPSNLCKRQLWGKLILWSFACLVKAAQTCSTQASHKPREF